MEPQKSQKHRFRIDKLEERIAPAHLGHDVLLPPAAAHGERGIDVATGTPAAHTRAQLILETLRR